MAIRINRFITAFCLTVVTGVVFGGNPSTSDAVTAGLNAGMHAKLAVSEKFSATGQWPESNAAADFEPLDGDASVKVGSGGVVTITFKGPAALTGKTIVMTPSSANKDIVHWSCKGIDFPADTLPKHCQ